MFDIVGLRQRPDLFEQAVELFWQVWGSETNLKFYEDCMKHSCETQSDLPRFYLALQNLYLFTDLENYYEKYGWSRITEGYIFNGDLTNIYIHPTGDASVSSQT